MLDLIQEALFGITFIADDIRQFFQRFGGIQCGGIIAVAGEGLHRKTIRTGDIVRHILADLLDHVVVAAIHCLVVISLILAVVIPVCIRNTCHFQAFRHHIEIADRAMTGNGFVEETLSVIAEDRPYAAKGEAGPGVDACRLTGTGSGLHRSARPEHHTNSGTVTSHGADIVDIRAVQAIRPGEITQLITEVEAHVRVTTKVTRGYHNRLCVDLEVLAVHIRKDSTGDLSVFMDQGKTLCTVNVLCAEFHCLLLEQADRIRPHIVVCVCFRAGVAPLGHADKVSAAAADTVKLLVTFIVAGMGILRHIILGQISQHPVQRLTGALGIIHDDLLVGMAEGLIHVLGEDVVRVIFLGALVQEEFGVVGGEVAGIVVILFPGLHFAADNLQTLVRAVQRGGGTRLTGTDYQNVSFFGVGDFPGQVRLIPQPCRLVVHELVFRDAKRIYHTDHHGTENVAVTLLDDVLFRCFGSFCIRIGTTVRLRITRGEDIIPGDIGIGNYFCSGRAARSLCLCLNRTAEQTACRDAESACRGPLQEVTA